MKSSRRKLNNNRSDGVNFDKRFEQFFEAGRQIADGFSGTRPGSRKKETFRDISRKNVRNIGNWMTDKMDSFFDDDYEEWNDDTYDEDENEFKSFSRSIETTDDFSFQGKKPLEAISLRLKDNIDEKQKRLPPSNDKYNQDWEEDSFFQTNNWKRPPKEKDYSHLDQKSDTKKISTIRNFPRSRRNRL
tara:strand:- start:115 stop:678 length:564 start_codon:yes stop_codon:yes gene_type:complete